MPLMAFCVPLDGSAACAVAIDGKAKTRTDTVRTARAGCWIIEPLRPGLMRMVPSEIEKPDLSILVLVNIRIGRCVVWNVVKRHPRSLPSQLIPNESEAGAIQGRPHFLNVVMIHQVRSPKGERIECHGQN